MPTYLVTVRHRTDIFIDADNYDAALRKYYNGDYLEDDASDPELTSIDATLWEEPHRD